MNLVCILVPTGWLIENSQTCTNTPVQMVNSYRYPTLTILIPVYKESFETVLRPTLLGAIQACTQYKQDTGVTATVCVNDDGLAIVSNDEKTRRVQFYESHGIVWSERPLAGRRGRFKKAGNLNYCLNRYSVGDIILLLDSDSRIPTRLHFAVREFADTSLGFLQMRTGTLYSEHPVLWEILVGHFTDTLYSLSFRALCSFGEPSPFVGHNAFLRRSALQTCAEYDFAPLSISSDETAVYGFQYFSEHHVSEDFDLSMRLQIAGFKGRYATYLEGFEEGVTLTALDEIIRLQKYAFGVNELTIFPLRQWWRCGILCPSFKTYLLSDRIALCTKYNIIGYMGMYYALAVSPLFVTLHYFAYFYIPTWSTMVTAEQTMYACAVTFGIGSPLAVLVLKYKLGLPLRILREMGCTVIFGIFFAGIGFPLLLAIASHFFGIPMSWSTTNKEMPTRIERLRDILRNCYLSIVWGILQLTIICVGWFVLQIHSWPAIVPMGVSAAAHVLVPFLGFLG